MFSEAPIGTTAFLNPSKEITRTFPPSLRPRLFYVMPTSLKSLKSLNGSLYCTNHIQTLRLTLLPRALIKVALPSDENATKNMQREVLTYRLAGVASAKCFRKMYDVIDDSTIALEWLDTTLAEVKYHPDMRIYSLIKTLLRAAFTSCVVLEDHKHVNTGRMSGLEELAFANYHRL